MGESATSLNPLPSCQGLASGTPHVSLHAFAYRSKKCPFGKFIQLVSPGAPFLYHHVGCPSHGQSSSRRRAGGFNLEMYSFTFLEDSRLQIVLQGQAQVDSQDRNTHQGQAQGSSGPRPEFVDEKLYTFSPSTLLPFRGDSAQSS